MSSLCVGSGVGVERGAALQYRVDQNVHAHLNINFVWDHLSFDYSRKSAIFSKKNEYFYRPSTVWRAHEWVVRMDSRRGHQNRRHFWCQPTQEAAGDRADAHSMHPTAFLFFKFLSGNQHDLIEYTTTLKSCSISRGFTAGKRTSTKVEQGWKTLHGITEVWKFE